MQVMVWLEMQCAMFPGSSLDTLGHHTTTCKHDLGYCGKCFSSKPQSGVHLETGQNVTVVTYVQLSCKANPAALDLSVTSLLHESQDTRCSN